jgi:outer membrane protein assembly factor BamB
MNDFNPKAGADMGSRARAGLPGGRLLAAAALWLSLPAGVAAQEVGPWATYRGNPQRTGNTDNQPGPAAPKVLWVMESKEHFIAAPVPHGEHLYVSGLGAFNAPIFSCLSTAPKPKERVLWSKSTPYPKLATVSSPGLSGGRLIFGDGMHQTDNATLYCMQQKDGMPIWQLYVPGKLVHLEGSPTIVGGKVYIGGGSAGVLCVDMERVSLEGKEMPLDAIQKTLAERWKKLLAQYEVEKKKDPDALPPSHDELPRPTPRRLWQQGEKKWHVDAPVAVAGDKVLAASAYLDLEKEGDRALFCMDAKTGTVRWRAPLKINPWGGPSVAGDLVVVSGSSIGYDTKALKGAKGQVAAFALADGKEKWRKDVTGGVVSCAALAGELAVVTATDGKVRAFDLQTGERRWNYEAKAPLFAPVAIAGGVVYAGDLRGVLHALQLSNGVPKWTFDLAKGPGVQAPGMIYGGPAVEGGRLYVATVNLEGAGTGRPTVVLCLGEK